MVDLALATGLYHSARCRRAVRIHLQLTDYPNHRLGDDVYDAYDFCQHGICPGDISGNELHHAANPADRCGLFVGLFDHTALGQTRRFCRTLLLLLGVSDSATLSAACFNDCKTLADYDYSRQKHRRCHVLLLPPPGC